MAKKKKIEKEEPEEELEEDLDIEDEEELKEAFEEIEEEESEEEKSSVCSFRIEVNKLKNYLKYLKCTGVDESGSKISLIKDCIIRFDEQKKKIWAIVSDGPRNIVAQVTAEVENIKNPAPIPIEIDELEKWLGTFEDSDIINFVYDTGIVGLNSVVKKEFLDFDLKTTVIFSTKILDAISNDLISVMEIGDENDLKYLDQIKKFGNSIFKKNKAGAKVFFGPVLSSNVELSSRQLKKIVSDGETIGHRLYPLEFSTDKITASVKSAEESKKNSISRDLYSKKYNIKTPFEILLATKFTNAVNNLSGYVLLHGAKDAPLLMESVDSKEKGLEIAYLVTTL